MGKFIIGLVVGLVLLLGYLIHFTNTEEKKWEAFKIKHHCKVISETEGSVSVVPIFGSNGAFSTATVTNPGTITYRCDNGIDYTR